MIDKKILIADAIDPVCKTTLESNGFRVDTEEKPSEEFLLKNINNYNALIVRSATKLPAKIIFAMDNVEVIGRAGAGVDTIDVNAATRKGILVMNTPGGNTYSTAEHTIAMMLSLCRNIPQANVSVKEGKWERKKYKGVEVYGKTIGIIGLGKIGKEVAQRCKSFGMTVLGFDPIFSKEIAHQMGIKLSSLDEIWKKADIITVHTPLNEHTKNLISSSTINKMKDDVLIINCARGGIVNEKDLIKEINSGKVAGAALDVYENEPPDSSDELINHPKVITTPHLGASTEEAQHRVAQQIAEQVMEYFKSGKTTGAVNLTGFESVLSEEVLPFIKLAEILGKISAQLLTNNLHQLEVEISGKNIIPSSNEIKLAVLKGLISKHSNESINYVNVLTIAEETGLTIKISTNSSDKDFLNLITVRTRSDKSGKEISGSVFGRNELRIVKIDNYLLEIKAEGNLLIYRNPDKPGMLSSVSSILADQNINIAGVSLGRSGREEEALTVISLDDRISDELINRISSINGISEVCTVSI